MRRWIILFSTALIILVSLMVLLAPAPPRVTLSDGSILEVTSVTFGTNHSFSTDSPTRARLRGLLPRRLKKLMPAPGLSRTFDTPRDGAVLWLTHFNPQTKSFLGFGDWDWNIVDEHGCTFLPSDWARSGSTNRPLAWVTTSTYPRRQREFKLVGRHKAEVASFKIRNPHPRRPQAWRAEALPATRQIGDVTVSLVKIDASFVSNVFLSLQPRFEFRQAGQLRTNGFTVESMFKDAMGNSDRALCPFEPTLRIEADVFPNAFADFPAARIIPLGTIDSPAPGSTATMEVSGRMSELGLFFAGFTGAGQFTLSNSVWAEAMPVTPPRVALNYGNSANTSDSRRGYWRRSVKVYRPSLWLAANNPLALEKYLARARDASGRIYPDQNNSRKCSQEEGIYFRNCFFALPADAGRIELELVPFEAQKVDFTVVPPKPVATAIH